VEIIFLHRSLYGYCNRKCSTVSTAVTHLEDSRYGSLYGQLCSLTMEAIQSFGLASSGKHSGKHSSPGGEGLAGYPHGRRAVSAPASSTAAVSLGTPLKFLALVVEQFLARLLNFVQSFCKKTWPANVKFLHRSVIYKYIQLTACKKLTH